MVQENNLLGIFLQNHLHIEVFYQTIFDAKHHNG